MGVIYGPAEAKAWT